MCYGQPAPDCLPVRQEAAHREESPLMEGGVEKDNLMIGWGEVSSSYDPPIALLAPKRPSRRSWRESTLLTSSGAD